MSRPDARLCLFTALGLVVDSVLFLSAAAAAVDVAPTNSAFTQHLAQLTKQLPEGFTLVVQPPFVVLGDESPDVVRRRATQTVKWAVDKLKQDYFRRDPREIIDIWLFKDGASYTNHAHLPL